MATPKPSGIIAIEPPIGGMVRRTGFQTQPPYTAYDCVNFWPFDAKTGRVSLATRPSLDSLSTPAGTGSGAVYGATPINGKATGKPSQSMLLNVDGKAYYYDSTGDWTAATGAQAEALSTGRSVYGAAMLEQVFIANSTTKPLVFDYDAGTVTSFPAETGGTAPSDCRIAFVWQGCLNLMGDPSNPQVWYQSREGDPLDYNYGADSSDLARAWATTLTDDSGKLLGPITAGMVKNQDTVVISCLGGMKTLSGRRPRGGVFADLPGVPYVLGQGAWTQVPDGTLYFMTIDGLYALPPKDGSLPVAVSKNFLPRSLKGIAYTLGDDNVQLAYSAWSNSLYIVVRGQNEQAWMYNLDLGGFFRMTLDDYPFVLQDFPSILTESSDSVMFCSYTGLSHFDAFGDDETFESSVIAGPIAITDNLMEKGLIQRLRFLFGRDTPASDVTGQLLIATGVDGQDAINRILIGESQFAADLSGMGAHDGIVVPRLAGQSMAIMFAIAGGDLVWENSQSVAVPWGRNRGLRSTQLSIEGTAYSATDYSDFDPDLWTGYSEGTPLAPNCTLPDWTHWVDLSYLPDSWWALVSAGGRDIRATDENGVQLPVDIVHCDTTAKTGLVCVKRTQTTTPIKIRLWAGNPLAGALDADDTYGQYATYDDNWVAFWPDGGARDDGEADRTSNTNDITLVNQVDEANNLVAGPIGASATDYVAQDATNNYGKATASVPDEPLTLIVVGKDEDATGLSCFGVRNSSSSANQYDLTAYRHETLGQKTQMNTYQGATTETAHSDLITKSSDWKHYAGVVAATDSRTAYIDGANSNENTDSVTDPTVDEIIVGKASRSGLSSSSATLDMALVQVHDAARSACWVAYQAAMLDQSTFWGWTEVVEVNDPPTTPDPPDDVYDGACPVGEVAVSETGTWSGYAEATPPAPTATLLDFSHWIDLSEMPANWWSAVNNDGSDIRATDDSDQFLPFDLVNFDSATTTGFLVVKCHQFVDTQTTIRIWVGNATAVDVDTCASYGQYEAYDAG